jgi:RND family efflux transporter MFP subunit
MRTVLLLTLEALLGVMLGLRTLSAMAEELDCLIEPHMQVELSSAVPGVLETVSVDRGDLIEKGQVLARLKDDVENATVELARARFEVDEEIKAKQANFAFRNRKQARSEELFKQKMVSFHEQDEAKTDALVAELELSLAKENKRLRELELQQAIENLQLRSLKSPIRGVVVARLLSPGESVENKPILKLAQLDPLNVEVIVPVALFGTVKPGMHAQVMPEAPVGGTYLADVKIIDRVIDAASGTFGVRLELPNPEYQLAAGLRCQVRFLSD